MLRVFALSSMQILYLIMNLVDLYSAKSMDLEFQSAFATILSISNCLLVLGSGIVLGADTFYTKKETYFNEGLSLSLIAGLASLSLALLSIPFYQGNRMSLFALLNYLNIPFFLHYLFLRQYSLIKANIPFKVSLFFLLGTLLKIVLNQILQDYFGILSFPIATLSAFVCIIASIHLQLRISNPRLKLKALTHEIRPLLRVGVPLGFQLMLRAFIFTLITVFLNLHRPELALAFSLVSLLASIIYVFPYGAGLLLSVNIHEIARRQQLSSTYIRTLLGSVFGYALLISILIYIDADILSQWFQSRTITSEVLRSGIQGYAIFQIFDTLYIFLAAIYRGLLQTQPIFQSFFLGMSLLGLPTAYYLSEVLGFGISGIWIGLSPGIALSGLILLKTNRMELNL